eukprot:416277-Rhodomonas_salina.1
MATSSSSTAMPTTAEAMTTAGMPTTTPVGSGLEQCGGLCDCQAFETGMGSIVDGSGGASYEAGS